MRGLGEVRAREADRVQRRTGAVAVEGAPRPQVGEFGETQASREFSSQPAGFFAARAFAAVAQLGATRITATALELQQPVKAGRLVVDVVAVLGEAVGGASRDQRTVTACGREHGTQGQHVVDGHVDHAFEVAQVVVAQRGVDLALEPIFRLVGDEVDGTCGGVSPVQRALRPAQHLDALQVEERGTGRLRAAEVDPVNLEGGGRVAHLGGVAADDAADGNVRRGVAAGRDQDVRCQRRQPDRRGGARGPQVFSTDRSDRQRSLGRQLAGALGRDDDIGESVLHRIFGHGLRRRPRWRQTTRRTSQRHGRQPATEQ